MKPKWISRKDYVAPFIQAAKNRGVKLSNKNLKRIDGLHCSWAINYFGINGGFRSCYEEHVSALLIHEPCKLLKAIQQTKLVKADTLIGSGYITVPVDFSKK